MKKLALLLAAAAPPLSGCAVTSFAPPIVKMDKELKFTRQQTSFNAVCSPNPADASARMIHEDVDGARLLIQNFILTYRCQAHRAAEGRQFFEVPQLAIAAGAITAAAFGAPPEVAIGAGASGAVFANGKSYYSPQEKASIIDNSLNALICIKTEAVGIDAFEIEQLDTAEKALRGDAPSPGHGLVGDPELEVSASKRYYDLIMASLLSVERVLAQRLSRVGSFDPEGVVAQIERLNQKIRNGGDDPETGENGSQGDAGGVNGQQGGATQGAGADAANAGAGANVAGVAKSRAKADGVFQSPAGQSAAAFAKTTPAALQSTRLDLNVLKPKLEKCVVRAKM